jgi:hypothetical protein
MKRRYEHQVMTSYGDIAIQVLMNRGAFDQWWSSVDGDVQQGIIDEINAEIRRQNITVPDAYYPEL